MPTPLRLVFDVADDMSESHGNRTRHTARLWLIGDATNHYGKGTFVQMGLDKDRGGLIIDSNTPLHELFGMRAGKRYTFVLHEEA
jgi:hypothetical protein